MQRRATRTLWLIVGLTLIFGCRSVKHSKKQFVQKENSLIYSPSNSKATDTVLGHASSNQAFVSKSLTTKEYYENAFSELDQMLSGKRELSFKRAVFVSENAFSNDSINYGSFCSTISILTGLCKSISESINLNEYKFSDSVKLKRNFAIFSVIKDTVTLSSGIKLLPYVYDFDDYNGRTNWTSTFVTKLLSTNSGNCHSLPFLYKILAEELNTEAYLSFAPNHIYLKHRSKRNGWYNTELTSGEFPTDAWIKASGYITLDAIRSGIYMDTLSRKQSIALCVYDLAKGYEVKTANYSDGFIIKCCDLILNYHPQNINAIILKAESLKHNYDGLMKSKNLEDANEIYKDMQTLYLEGLKLGYRDMPQEMYQAWLMSAKTEQDKYRDTEIKSTFKNESK